MDIQYEIYFFTKSKAISITVDGHPVHNENGKCIWNGIGGYHILRIQQVRKNQSKWYWVSEPIMFLLGIFASDIEFVGKTPFYAVYEANVLVEQDIEVSVSLFDSNKYWEGSNEYKINIEFPKEVSFEVVRDEFTATKKERLYWFLMQAGLFTLLFGVVEFISVSAGISSLNIGVGIVGAIFCGLLSVAVLAGWIFIICKLYRASSGK